MAIRRGHVGIVEILRALDSEPTEGVMLTSSDYAGISAMDTIASPILENYLEDTLESQFILDSQAQGPNIRLNTGCQY